MPSANLTVPSLQIWLLLFLIGYSISIYHFFNPRIKEKYYKFYCKFIFKLFKFNIFEIPAPKLSAPSILIPLRLNKMNIPIWFHFYKTKKLKFYFRSKFKRFNFSNFEIPSINFAAPSTLIALSLKNYQIYNPFSFLSQPRNINKINYKYFNKLKYLP